MYRIQAIFAGLVLGAMIALPAAAQSAAGAAPATLLGVYENWSAFQTGSGSSLTCYALSKPRAVRPRGAKRGPIYLMVSTWPARKVRAEPQIVYGYPANEKGAAAVATGISQRGTRTVDTYSLAGFTDALAKVHASCPM